MSGQKEAWNTACLVLVCNFFSRENAAQLLPELGQLNIERGETASASVWFTNHRSTEERSAVQSRSWEFAASHA